jgi:hypothetical protein
MKTYPNDAKNVERKRTSSRSRHFRMGHDYLFHTSGGISALGYGEKKKAGVSLKQNNN